jgi:hypothetical protein
MTPPLFLFLRTKKPGPLTWDPGFIQMVYAKAVLWRQKTPCRAASSTDPGENGIRAGKGEYRGIDGHNTVSRTGNALHIPIPPLRFRDYDEYLIHHTLFFVKRATPRDYPDRLTVGACIWLCA